MLAYLLLSALVSANTAERVHVSQASSQLNLTDGSDFGRLIARWKSNRKVVFCLRNYPEKLLSEQVLEVITRAVESWSATADMVQVSYDPHCVDAADVLVAFTSAQETSEIERSLGYRIGCEPAIIYGEKAVEKLVGGPAGAPQNSQTGEMVAVLAYGQQACNWTVERLLGQTMYNVGRLLGLARSRDAGDVMYAAQPSTVLSPNDVRAVQAIYGNRTTVSAADVQPVRRASAAHRAICRGRFDTVFQYAGSVFVLNGEDATEFANGTLGRTVKSDNLFPPGYPHGLRGVYECHLDGNQYFWTENEVSHMTESGWQQERVKDKWGKDGPYDAIFDVGHSTYFFGGADYFRRDGARGLTPGYPKKATDWVDGLATPLDGAVAVGSNVLFFKSPFVWVFERDNGVANKMHAAHFFSC